MLRRSSTLVVAGLLVLLAGLNTSGYQISAVKQAPIPDSGGYEYYAAKLGIWYRLVPYGYGGSYTSNQGNYNPNFPPGSYPAQAPVTYGARLSRYPVAGSPCAYLQLEPGDMIVSLDNLPFYGPNDILSHYGPTSMIFVNVRTGQPQPAFVLLQ